MEVLKRKNYETVGIHEEIFYIYSTPGMMKAVRRSFSEKTFPKHQYPFNQRAS